MGLRVRGVSTFGTWPTPNAQNILRLNLFGLIGLIGLY